MNVMLLSNDEKENEVIEKLLAETGHKIVKAGTTQTAMERLQEGGIRFVIADRNTTDIDEKKFIQRIREAQPPYYIYILLVASKVSEADVTTPRGGADDYLNKPIVPLAFKTRLQLGQRMLGLGDNLVHARSTLEKTAIFDPITKTLNEAAFVSLARGELERARRNQTPLSLIALDIKNFDQIRQSHGEQIAQETLVFLAQMIRDKSRTYDGTGRSGESMFLIPLPGVIGQDAEKITLRILHGIDNAELTTKDGAQLDLKVGAGLVSVSRVNSSLEIETLISKVREAAIRAETMGDDQIMAEFF